MFVCVTHWYCVKTAERIQLNFGIEVLSAHPALCEKEIEHKGTFLWDFSETLDLEKLGHGTSSVAVCHKQATIVSLLLKTLGDDGRRDQVTVASPADYSASSRVYSAMGDWA